MTFDPEQNRIPTGLLTEDERAALGAAKHGWQRYHDGRWWESTPPLWAPWAADAVYRAKPAPAPTILVNGIEVPEPVRKALEKGCRYWMANPTSPYLYSELCWGGDDTDRRWLSRGLIHLTEAAAVAHAKAMLAPSMRGVV